MHSWCSDDLEVFDLDFLVGALEDDTRRRKRGRIVAHDQVADCRAGQTARPSLVGEIAARWKSDHQERDLSRRQPLSEETVRSRKLPAAAADGSSRRFQSDA